MKPASRILIIAYSVYIVFPVNLWCWFVVTDICWRHLTRGRQDRLTQLNRMRVLTLWSQPHSINLVSVGLHSA